MESLARFMATFPPAIHSGHQSRHTTTIGWGQCRKGKARVVVKVVTIVNLIRQAIVTGNNQHRKGLALGPGCHTGRHYVERIPPLEHSRNFYAPAPRGA